MKFSDINVMPHTDKVKEEFNVSNWSEKAIKHVESDKVAYIPALPMHRKHIWRLKRSGRIKNDWIRWSDRMDLKSIGTGMLVIGDGDDD